MFRLSRFQILLLLLLCNELVRAISAATSDPKVEEPSATSVDNRPKRTLFNIIFGCASTIVISAWRSVHPNIPPEESYFKSTLRKLDLLVCTIIAPEILPLWALKQRIAAARVSNIYNSKRGLPEVPKKKADREKWFSLREIKDDENEAWTSTHGHYLIMGGFQLIEPVDETGNSPLSDMDQDSATTTDPLVQRADTEKGPVSSKRATILTQEMLTQLVEDPDFRIHVTEREINDKSKADGVSKIIFVLQTCLFITQCTARGFQGLEITQLELTTVAYSILSIANFIIWMEKPLRSRVAMRVHLQRRLTEKEINTGRDPKRESLRSKLPADIKRYFERGLNILQFDRTPFAFLARLSVLPLLILAFVLSPIIVIISAITLIFYDVMFTSSSFPVDASHVPTYYTPKTELPWYYYAIILSIQCIVVGGIHCAGWNLAFPTDTQRDLWHGASLAVTILPSLSFLIHTTFSPIFKLQRVRTVVQIGVVVYVAAKVFLVAQALALLKNQPPSAFLAVDWTKFIPHV